MQVYCFGRCDCCEEVGGLKTEKIFCGAETGAFTEARYQLHHRSLKAVEHLSFIHSVHCFVVGFGFGGAIFGDDADVRYHWRVSEIS